MQSFKIEAAAAAAAPSPNSDMYSSHFYQRGDEFPLNQTRFADIGDLQHSHAGFHHQHQHQHQHQHHAVDLSPSSIYIMKTSNVAALISNNFQFGELTSSITSLEFGSMGTGVDIGNLMLQHRGTAAMVGLGNGDFENWGDSGMADNSQHTDTSTDVDTTDDKYQSHGVQHGAPVVVDSMDQSKGRTGDQKTLRRLVQNREAARKSRLRKKAYVKQLEQSRLKLTQLEQELQQARQQGIFVATGLSGDHSHSIVGNGALAFDMDYAHWLNEHQRLINDLRSAVNSHTGDNELSLLVDGIMSHYDEIFRLKGVGAKSDVFHMLSGMWKTPAERCFMWLGGFRSSELLKVIDCFTILGNHLEPLTDQQLMGLCNLQQSSQQAEDALSQGMEALQQSLVETLSSNCLGPTGSGNVADYMGQMAIAMGKLATLENFLHQADLLRQQTLQQMHRILTTSQAARALLVITDYMSRLRALSSLWLARPKD
ncbi:transcription factor TGA2.3-like isoform X2 [Camellia sinensis]|uniref:transcription factor TGA2.3-like isoform X2 n=1 Tax=Camellia sinensis TaxID=4442 RepID=UPI001035FF71|nr:transcription factor TGA2.3-like isoform X2 [Camellia sinensis]